MSGARGKDDEISKHWNWVMIFNTYMTNTNSPLVQRREVRVILKEEQES